MGELRCGGVAVWRSCGVGESWCGQVAVGGSCDVGESQYGYVAVCGVAVYGGPSGYQTLDHCVLGVSLVFRVYREKLII